MDTSYLENQLGNGFPTGIVIAGGIALVLFIIVLAAFKTARKIFGGIFLAAGIGGVVYGFIRMESLESKIIRNVGGSDKQMIAVFVAGGVVLLLGIIMLAIGSSRSRNTYAGQMQPPPYQMPNPNYQMQPPPYQMPNQNYQAPNQNYQMQQPQNFQPEGPAKVQCSNCQALSDAGSKFCRNCGNQL